MARLHRMVVYIADLGDDFSDEEIHNRVQDADEDSFVGTFIRQVENHDSVSVEWSDEIDLNYSSADKATWDKYFDR